MHKCKALTFILIKTAALSSMQMLHPVLGQVDIQAVEQSS